MKDYINDSKVNSEIQLKNSDGFCFDYKGNSEYGENTQKVFKIKEGLYLFIADSISKEGSVKKSDNIFDQDIIGIYHYTNGGVLLQIENYVGKFSSGDTFYLVGNPKNVIATPLSERHSVIGFICYAEMLDIIIDEYQLCRDIDMKNFYNDLKNIHEPFIMKTSFNLTLLINDIFKYIEKNNYYMIKNKAFELLYKSICQYENFSEKSLRTYKVEAIELVHQIKEYIDLNYREKILISQLVKRYNINKTYFYEIFNYLYDISPYKYIVKLRLSEAYSLLIKTDLSVEEISYSCGYDNVNKFINSFKRIYGKTPGKVRI